jgi:hypothetical protein
MAASLVNVALDGRRCSILIAEGEDPEGLADIRRYQLPNSKINLHR